MQRTPNDITSDSMLADKPARPSTQTRRREVLLAALACFADKGVGRTTVQDICSASNCSVGSLYHHFGSKEGVASELFIYGVGLLNEDLLQKLTRCRTVAGGVKTVVIQYSDWVTEHPVLARFLNAGEVEFTPSAHQALRTLYRQHISAVFEWFAPYVVSGQMRKLPPETYVPLISGPIRDYTRQWLSGRVQQPPAAVKNLFAEAAWNAVRSTS